MGSDPFQARVDARFDLKTEQMFVNQNEVIWGGAFGIPNDL
jgi:hypothetical protein